MEDDWWEAEQEEGLARLYEAHKEQAIEEFTEERLKSYYLDHPNIVDGPMWLYNEAQVLCREHPGASLVLAAGSIEVAVKDVILKPVVFGLVHQESLASFITEIAFRRTGLDNYRNLLFRLFAERGGVDLAAYRRPGASATLWEEVREVGSRRNQVLHRAQRSSIEDGMKAIAVAEHVLKSQLPELLKKLGLHLHPGPRICGEYPCSGSTHWTI